MRRHLNWILAGLMFILGFSSIIYAKDDELSARVNVSTASMLDCIDNAENRKTVVIWFLKGSKKV